MAKYQHVLSALDYEVIPPRVRPGPLDIFPRMCDCLYKRIRPLCWCAVPGWLAFSQGELGNRQRLPQPQPATVFWRTSARLSTINCFGLSSRKSCPAQNIISLQSSRSTWICFRSAVTFRRRFCFCFGMESGKVCWFHPTKALAHLHGRASEGGRASWTEERDKGRGRALCKLCTWVCAPAQAPQLAALGTAAGSRTSFFLPQETKWPEEGSSGTMLWKSATPRLGRARREECVPSLLQEPRVGPPSLLWPLSGVSKPFPRHVCMSKG